MKQRLAYLGIGVVVFLIAYSVGASIKLSDKDAKDLRNQFSQKVKGIDQTGIFLNNLAIAVGMFVPGVGVGIGVYSGVSTGMVYSAYAAASPVLAKIPALAVLFTPFGMLELLAYGLAISRSGMLVLQLLKRRPPQEYVFPTLVEIGIVVAALLGGAIIESQLISLAQVTPRAQ